MSTAKGNASNTNRVVDIKGDQDERMLPRTSPRVRPVDHPAFDEPSTSRVPSQMMTPNNMSSFIELLNYNSDTETDPNDLGKSRLSSAKQDGIRGDTTQEFIQEALADLKASNSKQKRSIQPKEGGTQLDQPEKVMRRKKTQMFSNIDESMKQHPVCSFPGLNFVRPIKHSARMVLPDPPVSLHLSDLKPLVGVLNLGNCFAESRSAMRSRRHSKSASIAKQIYAFRRQAAVDV